MKDEKHQIGSLLRFGIQANMDAELRRKIFLSNALSLSMAFLVLLILINDYFFAKNLLAGHRRVALLLFLIVIPIINKYGANILARALLVFIPGFTVFIVPIIIKDFFPGQLFWFHYGTALLSSFSILLFHHKKEKIYVWVFFLFYFILTVAIDSLLLHYNEDGYNFQFISGNFTDYKLPPIFVSLVFCSTVYWFNTINVTYGAKLKLAYEDLKNTNEELLAKTEQLDELNRNLEKLVKVRSDVIASKEKQIIEYANLNAHKVRGPLARILGLINLTSYTEGTEELKKLIDKMNYSAAELNDIIIEMNNILSEEKVN